MILSIIVAADENNAIGKDNDLLCHLPNDLKYFKRVTEGHTVIMGRKTFESLPKGALPNRRNIVITRDRDLKFDRCEMVSSLEEAIALCMHEDELFVIGGGSVYSQALGLADRLYLTKIHHKFNGADVFLPSIDISEWSLAHHETYLADEKNQYAHSFEVYDKIKC